MNDKMTVLTEWLRTIGMFYINNNNNNNKNIKITDDLLQINLLQTGADFDTAEQLHSKLKRYKTEIETLRNKGIGK